MVCICLSLFIHLFVHLLIGIQVVSIFGYYKQRSLEHSYFCELSFILGKFPRKELLHCIISFCGKLSN